MKQRHLTENELVRKIIRGDQQAFRQAFYQYKDRLFSYCYRFTKSEEVAEEIVHDALLKIWADRHRLDPNRSFISYLYTITRNLSLNFLKKLAAEEALKTQVSHLASGVSNDTVEAVHYASLTYVAEQAVQQLPFQQQQIYRMSRQRAMSHEEIAQHLNISKHTVRNHIIKALQSIKRHLRLHTDITFLLLYLFLAHYH